MNIYVGNLPTKLDDKDIQDLFEKFGEVTSVQIMRDASTGMCRGHGFVLMREGAVKAIESLNGSSFNGKNIRVNEALPHIDTRNTKRT